MELRLCNNSLLPVYGQVKRITSFITKCTVNFRVRGTELVALVAVMAIAVLVIGLSFRHQHLESIVTIRISAHTCTQHENIEPELRSGTPLESFVSSNTQTAVAGMAVVCLL